MGNYLDARRGRQVARESITRTGLTHRGKASLGRPVKANAAEVARWQREGGASLAKTSEHWSLSLATVKRCCACSKSVVWI